MGAAVVLLISMVVSIGCDRIQGDTARGTLAWAYDGLYRVLEWKRARSIQVQLALFMDKAKS